MVLILIIIMNECYEYYYYSGIFDYNIFLL